MEAIPLDDITKKRLKAWQDNYETRHKWMGNQAYIYELEQYSSSYLVELSTGEAEELVNLLSLTFKTSVPKLDWNNRMRRGSYYRGGRTISLSPYLVGLNSVVHEYSHHLADMKHHKSISHGRKFVRWLDEAYKVALKWDEARCWKVVCGEAVVKELHCTDCKFNNAYLKKYGIEKMYKCRYFRGVV